MEPALDTATAAAGGVVLRVKRRRDAQAPEQIVLEATSRVAALASDFGRSMGIAATAPEPAVEDVGTAPPKKRCRFVLLKAAAVTQPQVPPAPAAGNQPGDGAAAAASQAQDAAATLRAASTAGGLPPGCTRVLDLWHASGVPQQAASSSAAAAATAAAAGSTPTVLQQPDFSAAQAAGVPSGQQQHSNEQLSVYEDMLQQYLQQRPQQAAAVGQTAHKPHKPPSRRTHRQPAAIAEQQSNTQQQQEEQQLRPALPDYMTREMLQQYGLLGRITGNLQPHASGPSSATAAAGPSSAAGATADAVKGTEAPAQDDEHEYVYDMYVPVLDEVMTPVEEVDGAEGQQLGAMPVVKVWEEDLQDFDDLWPTAPGTAAAAGEDSEDSNAEGYYGNSYPDEDDSYQADAEGDGYDGGYGGYGEDGSYGSSEEEGGANYKRGGSGYYGGDEEVYSSSRLAPDSEAAAAQVCAVGGAGGVITCYKRRSRPHGRLLGVPHGGESDEEFDVDDYISSGDEQEQQQQQQQLSGGAAWRAVLAEQYAPGRLREM